MFSAALKWYLLPLFLSLRVLSSLTLEVCMQIIMSYEELFLFTHLTLNVKHGKFHCILLAVNILIKFDGKQTASLLPHFAYLNWKFSSLFESCRWYFLCNFCSSVKKGEKSFELCNCNTTQEMLLKIASQ